jgi:hypothetical protein
MAKRMLYAITYIHDDKAGLCTTVGVYTTRDRAVQAVVDHELLFSMNKEYTEYEIREFFSEGNYSSKIGDRYLISSVQLDDKI